MPAGKMQIETIPIHKLICDPNNARKHPDKNLDAIKGSLVKFGQQKPIVINKDNVIVAGNGTVTAARLLQWKEIKCIRTNLDKFNQGAFAIADNRTSEIADWDNDILGNTLQALREDDFNLEDIGFDMSDIEEILEEKPEKESKNIEEVNDEFLIVIECKGEEEQQTLYEELLQRKIECKIMS